MHNYVPLDPILIIADIREGTVDHVSGCARESHEETNCAHLNVIGLEVGKIQDFRPTTEGKSDRAYSARDAQTCERRAWHCFA